MIIFVIKPENLLICLLSCAREMLILSSESNEMKDNALRILMEIVTIDRFSSVFEMASFGNTFLNQICTDLTQSINSNKSGKEEELDNVLKSLKI